MTSHAGTLDRLATNLVGATPLWRALPGTLSGSPLGVPAPPAKTLAALQIVLDRSTARLDLPALRLTAEPRDLRAGELVISGHLRLAELLRDAEVLAGYGAAEFDRAASGALGAITIPTVVLGRDGAPLRCYAVGPVDAPAVVLAAPCGMPVGIVGRWLRWLSASYRVLTWESRGLFEPDPGFDQRGHDLATQGEDLLAVLEAFDVQTAHVLGLCGGVPVALAAAVSPRVASVSLWHGDYELGEDAPKTEHQHDVQALLTMAGRDRTKAAGLYRVFTQPSVVGRLRAGLAHHLLYPYANPELLYRYGRLNGAIMSTDCRPLLAAVDKPTLVVTSHQDTTAHPAGSIHAAARIPRARLHLTSGCDHLAAIDAAPELLRLGRAFIEEALVEERTYAR